MLNFGKREPETYADLAAKPAQLLTKEFTLCSHKQGYWFGSSSEVSDGTGTYLRVVGDCKGCKRPMVKFHVKDTEPA